MDTNWFWSMLRSISLFLDGIVYPFISTVYNLLMDIANTTIFNEDIFTAFSSKVYALLGVFMLFKLSFSVLTYIINPDEFTDKNKGFGKLISNVIITLILLVATPFIFEKAMELQTIILKDNVIGRIFSTSATTNNSYIDAGDKIAYQTLKAFYYVDVNKYGACENLEQLMAEDGDISACLDAAFANTDKHDEYETVLFGSYVSNNPSLYLDLDLSNAEAPDGSYSMSYYAFISTAAGVIVVLLLLVFCFDVAVRSIKLGFLRMLAPVPIISRLDPKKGKDTFDKWLKMCISTYLDLFIRLLAIFFAVFVINQVISLKMYDATTGQETSVNAFVIAFIIIGALLFAKQLPKLIEDLTGVKMDGKFTLNPMNKLRQTPLVGAAMTGGAALLGGAITGGIAGAEAGNVFRGAWQGMWGAGKGIKDKISLMGDDKGKSPHAFSSGMQSGYKTIKGKDFEIWSPWRHIGSSVGEEKIKELKTDKYALQNKQAVLDAELQKFYDEYKNATPERQTELRKLIESNRSDYGKLSKHISVIDDQVKDIKKLYHVDDSPTSDLREARAEAQRPMPSVMPSAPDPFANQVDGQMVMPGVFDELPNDEQIIPWSPDDGKNS